MIEVRDAAKSQPQEPMQVWRYSRVQRQPTTATPGKGKRAARLLLPVGMEPHQLSLSVLTHESVLAG